MSDLLETISAMFPPVLSGHLAARMGEGMNGMKRALQGAVPVMLNGMITRAAAEELLARGQQVYRIDYVTQPGVTGILILLGSKEAPDSAMIEGRRLVAEVLGSAEQAAITELSRYARIQPAVARELLELVSTALLGALGQYAARHELNADGLADALLRLRGRVRAMTPPELENLVSVPELREQPYGNPLATPYAVLQHAMGRHIWSQWYIVAALVLMMTGVGAAAFEALRTVPTAQLPARAGLSQAPETVTVVAKESTLPLRADL